MDTKVGTLTCKSHKFKSGSLSSPKRARAVTQVRGLPLSCILRCLCAALCACSSANNWPRGTKRSSWKMDVTCVLSIIDILCHI